MGLMLPLMGICFLFAVGKHVSALGRVLSVARDSFPGLVWRPSTGLGSTPDKISLSLQGISSSSCLLACNLVTTTMTSSETVGLFCLLSSKFEFWDITP